MVKLIDPTHTPRIFMAVKEASNDDTIASSGLLPIHHYSLLKSFYNLNYKDSPIFPNRTMLKRSISRHD